jgi:hypothetical protein
MPKTGALSVVMDSGLIQQLRSDARELRRPVSHIVKGLVADHYSLFGLPRPMVELLERDRLSDPRGLDRRQYIMELLGVRYRALLLDGHE